MTIAVIQFEHATADIAHLELRVIAARHPARVVGLAHEGHAIERELLARLRACIRDIGRAAMRNRTSRRMKESGTSQPKPGRTESAPAIDDLHRHLQSATRARQIQRH